MSTEQNIQTIKQMYQAFGSGDVQAILDRVTDDVDWSTDAAIESAPSGTKIASTWRAAWTTFCTEACISARSSG